MPPSPLKQLKDIPTIAYLYRTKTLLTATGIDIPANQEYNNKICTLQYDLTKLQVDAIVNAANKRLLGGGGVDGAIHMAAGPELLDECRKLKGCETGSAKITDAYNLPCKKVMHAVGPVYENEQESEPLLRGCYRTALELAVQNDCRSVAFSAISTGVYGYPSRAAAKAALREVLTFLRRPEGKDLDKVIFCNFLDKDVDAYADAIPTIFPPTEGDLSESVSPQVECQSVLESLQKEEDNARSQNLPKVTQTWGVSASNQDVDQDECASGDTSKESRSSLDNRQEVPNLDKEVLEEANRKGIDEEGVDTHLAVLTGSISGTNTLVQVADTTLEARCGARDTATDIFTDATSSISTNHSEIEDEDKTPASGRQDGRTKADYDIQGRGYLGPRPGGSLIMTSVNGAAGEVKDMRSIWDVLEKQHDLRVDDGSESFGLWPKGRLRCGSCNAIVAYK